MAEAWYTKEDVLRGLEEVSPGQIVADVDDSHLVYGNMQPPRPRVYDNEEEEMELLYGSNARHLMGQGDEAHQSNLPAPDLLGITHMLRMVQKYEQSSDDDSSCSPRKGIAISKPGFTKVESSNVKVSKRVDKTKDIKSNSKNDEICSEQILKNNIYAISNCNNCAEEEEKENGHDINITTTSLKSKLNPNVKEFVPRSFSNSTSTICDSPSVGSSSTPDKESTSDLKLTKVSKDDINTGKTKEEKKKVELYIKSSIPAKINTFHEQQNTSLAIAKLLKLYAKPKAEKPVKLLPPDYFMQTSSKSEYAANKCEPKSDDLSETKHDNCIANATNNIESTEETEIMNDNVENTEQEGTQLTPNMAECDIVCKMPPIQKSLQPIETMDPHERINMKVSIDKVNNWLDDKPVVSPENVTAHISKEKLNAKSPILNASSVAFKRKESSSEVRRSPCEMTKKIPKPAIAEFKPSSYAQELHKKYSERSKASTPVPTLNIWEKLEADLKKKDEEIKNKKST